MFIAPGCNQYLSLDATFVVLTGGATAAAYSQNFPNFANLVGLELFAQGVSFDAVSLAVQTSNGLRLYLETF